MTGFLNWFQNYSVIGALGMFVVITVVTYWPSQRTRARMEHNAAIPLQDER